MGSIVNPISFRLGWSRYWSPVWSLSLNTPVINARIHQIDSFLQAYIGKIIRVETRRFYFLCDNIRIVRESSGHLTVLVPFYSVNLERFLDEFCFFMFDEKKRKFYTVIQSRDQKPMPYILKTWRPDLLEFEKRPRNRKNAFMVRLKRELDNWEGLVKVRRYCDTAKTYRFARSRFMLHKSQFRRRLPRYLFRGQLKYILFPSKPPLRYLQQYKASCQRFRKALKYIDWSVSHFYSIFRCAVKKIFIHQFLNTRSKIIYNAFARSPFSVAHDCSFVFFPWIWENIDAGGFVRFMRDKFSSFSTLNQVLRTARYMTKQLMLQEYILGWKIMYKGRFRRLGRRGRATYAWEHRGALPLNTTSAHISYGSMATRLRYSTCGLQVWLYCSPRAQNRPW